MMRKLLITVCLLFVFGPLWGSEWELFFPENYPNLQDMPLNGIASRKINSDSHAREYLIGSRGGKIVWGYPDGEPGSIEWRVIQTPLTFDITDVDLLGERWIVSGSHENKQLFQYIGPVLNSISEGIFTVADALEKDWEPLGNPIPWGHNERLGAIEILGESIIADFEKVSTDNGSTWGRIQTPSTSNYFLDVIRFQGSFLGATYSYSDGLKLLRSEDGASWDLVWTVDMLFLNELELMVLPDEWDDNGHPIEDSMALYVFAGFDDSGSPEKHYGLSLSTDDGLIWRDNGSSVTILQPEPVLLDQWNPLDLPFDRLGLPHPGRRKGSASGDRLLYRACPREASACQGTG